MPTTYAIPNGRTVMDATLYTGNGATGRLITNNDTGTNGFLPDLTWIKCRSYAYNHNLYDSNRGAPLFLSPNLTAAESSGDLVAFNSNGFTVNQTSGYELNANGQTYVAWQWNAGSNTTVSNTSGTITSTVSANTTAGFSIVKYTGNGSSAQTVGHGLGVAPNLILVKNRVGPTGGDPANYWCVWHSSVPTLAGYLNTNDNFANNNYAYYAFNNATAPTSSVFSVSRGGTYPSAMTNGSAGGGGGNTLVAYCWAAVAGFSAFGSYTGNGSADGPFVYTNFQPSFWMVKRTDSASDWFMMDSARNTYNVANLPLIPDSSGAEFTYTTIDFLSNGFKIRNTGADINASGGNYIYAAFASNPFKFSNAR